MTRFQSIEPRDALKPFVKAFVIQESDGVRYTKILPDTSVVMGFQYSGRLSFVDSDQATSLSVAGVTGLRDRFRIVKSTRALGSILVFFQPQGASCFFPMPLHEIRDASIGLNEVFPEAVINEVNEKLCLCRSDSSRIQLIEDFLLRQLKKRSMVTDHLVTEALLLLEATGGNERISVMARKLKISKRQMERRFGAGLGASPKQFATILRFKKAIASFDQSTSLTELAYDLGYFDQAHFIKDFKNFSGETPQQFFGL